MMKKKPQIKKRILKKPIINTKNLPIKKKKLTFLGNLHVQASFKNTILYLTNKEGKLIKQISTKSLKKTTFKKNTTYNINGIVFKMNSFLKKKRIKKLNIIIKGTAYGRRNIVRNLDREIRILSARYKVLRPFNGCRKKKKKRR
jgi:ribosomal protein S11